MSEAYQSFRLITAKFPVQFPALGRSWSLELVDIGGTACWRAHLVPDNARQTSSAGYFVESGFDRSNLVDRLTFRGVDMLRRSPVAALFRAMETQGLAERLPCLLSREESALF